MLHVYRLTDYEWWLGASLEEAMADAAVCWGPYDALWCIQEGMFDDAYQLDQAELERKRFAAEFGGQTFAQALDDARLEDPKTPRLFACSDW